MAEIGEEKEIFICTKFVRLLNKIKDQNEVKKSGDLSHFCMYQKSIFTHCIFTVVITFHRPYLRLADRRCLLFPPPLLLSASRSSGRCSRRTHSSCSLSDSWIAWKMCFSVSSNSSPAFELKLAKKIMRNSWIIWFFLLIYFICFYIIY